MDLVSYVTCYPYLLIIKQPVQPLKSFVKPVFKTSKGSHYAALGNLGLRSVSTFTFRVWLSTVMVRLGLRLRLYPLPLTGSQYSKCLEMIQEITSILKTLHESILYIGPGWSLEEQTIRLAVLSQMAGLSVNLTLGVTDFGWCSIVSCRVTY